jgi:type IV pilus assembly protein PilQ
MRKLSFVLLTLLLLVVGHTTLFANNAIKQFTLKISNDNHVALYLEFTNAVKEKPISFTMSNPERLVLDFANMGSALKKEHMRYNSRLVSKVEFINAGQRLRVIIQLHKNVEHQVSLRDKQVVVNLKSDLPTSTLPNATLKSIEFNNGEEANSGKIVLSLSQSGVTTKIDNQTKQFVISLNNTKLAKDLAHKYDVADFKTPAKSISLYQHGNDVQLLVHTTDEYQLATYELNKQYIIDIVPTYANPQNKTDKFQGKRISLNFQDIPVRQVLQVIAEFTHENLIINDSVKGNISLRLEQVPWDQALQIILQTQGLVERRVGNVLMIAPAGELAAQDLKKMQAQEEIGNLGPLESATFSIKYGKAETYYDTLKSPDNTLLSSRGTIILNKRTNMLFIKDTAQKLKGIQAYIDKTDIPVKQVEIEARIVTVDKSFERQLGIKWNVEGSTTPNPSGGAAGANGFNLDLGATDIGKTAPARLAYSTLASGVLIGLELSALEAEGGGEILSSPRLLTADQQEAVIEQGTEIPYNESTSSGAAAIAFKQAVLRLRVTPQITPNNKVLLKLQVNQDAKSQETSGKDAIPIIDTRHITTNVLVDNGETVVLGGIYERSKTQSVTRVPFLSAIPFIGELFKHRSIKDTRKELLIFVTPRIVHHDLLPKQ